MTTGRKELIGCGAVLIAAMIGVACFSLGAFVGAQGWTLGRPAAPGQYLRIIRPGDQCRCAFCVGPQAR